MATHDHFPMFIDTKGKKVVVVGGGKIAERRIHTLVHFSFDVTFAADMSADVKFQLGNIGNAASAGVHDVTLSSIKWTKNN